MFLRAMARCRSWSFMSHLSRAILRAASDIRCQWKGCTSAARSVPVRFPTSSCPHQTWPLGGFGRTRVKTVSPVHVNVLPSRGCRRTFWSTSCPHQLSSMSSSSGQIPPGNMGLVSLATSMFSMGIGGASSSSHSSGENKVVRGRLWVRTKYFPWMLHVSLSSGC